MPEKIEYTTEIFIYSALRIMVIDGDFMGKAKPIEENRVLLRIIEYLQDHEQSFPEQIARAVKCNSRNVLYYIERYPEMFAVERLGGNQRTYMKIVRLRPGALTRQGQMLSKVLKEYD